MRSSGSPESLSLDRDLPTTSDDVAALAGPSPPGPSDLVAYLRFLAGFRRLRSRPRAGAPGGVPFCARTIAA